MEILRKSQKERLEIKHPVTEMKNAFDGFISRLDTAEERISELGDILIEHFKTKKLQWGINSRESEWPL